MNDAISYVTIREVGPRDGLQSEQPVAAAERARFIDALAAHRRAPHRGGQLRVTQGGAGDGRSRRRARRDRLASRRHVVGARAQPARRRDGGGGRHRGAHGHDLGRPRLQREERAHVDRRQRGGDLRDRRASPAGRPVDAVVSCCFGSPYSGETAARRRGRARRPPARPRRHRSSRSPTPPGWRRRRACGRCSPSAAPTSASTSTTPAARRSSTRTRRSAAVSAGSTPRPAGSAAPRSPRAPAATCRPRTSSTCSTTRASPPASTSARVLDAVSVLREVVGHDVPGRSRDVRASYERLTRRISRGRAAPRSARRCRA